MIKGGRIPIESHLAYSANASIIVGMGTSLSNILRKNSYSSALDRTDIATLGRLQNNARLSVKEIAAGGRTRALICARSDQWDAGVLRGINVEVDPRVRGIGLEVLFMISCPSWLPHRIFKSSDDIIDHRCYAWNTLVDQPWEIVSTARRDWAAVGYPI